jgi:hypothetical protein
VNRPDCEVKGHCCNNKLVRQYTFKKRRGDKEEPPIFYACFSCLGFTLRGDRPIPYTPPAT